MNVLPHKVEEPKPEPGMQIDGCRMVDPVLVWPQRKLEPVPVRSYKKGRPKYVCNGKVVTE